MVIKVKRPFKRRHGPKPIAGLKPTQVNLDPEARAIIDEYKLKWGVSMGEVIRRALKALNTGGEG